MQLLSINTAIPEAIEIEGKMVLTGIYKQPVHKEIEVHQLGLEGDDQADKRYHGGVDQAIYCYSANHYAYWQDALNVTEMPYGTFGENLTVTDFDETVICIGDVLQVGSVQLQITKPRIPCFKLAHKLNNKSIIKTFLRSGLSGAYCRVLQEGVIAPSQTIEIITRDPQAISVKTALTLQKLDLTLIENPKILLSKALSIQSLTSELHADYTKRLQMLNE